MLFLVSLTLTMSRSARTARIEIEKLGEIVQGYAVAVRKDRED